MELIITENPETETTANEITLDPTASGIAMTDKELKKKMNAEKRVSYLKEYQVKYRPDYYSKNKSMILERQKKYNLEHDEEVKQRKKKWYIRKKAKLSSSPTK
jgi:hypothetical protein